MKDNTICFMAFAVLISGCSGNDEAALMCVGRAVPSFAAPPAEPCDSFSSVFAAKNSMGAVATSFARGAPVTLELQITNNASTAKTLQIADGCGQTVFEVDRRGPELCRVFTNANPGPCTTQVVLNSFAPGETKTFSATWPQTNSDGSAAGTGTYRGYVMERSQCGAKFYSSAPTFTVQ